MWEISLVVGAKGRATGFPHGHSYYWVIHGKMCQWKSKADVKMHVQTYLESLLSKKCTASSIQKRTADPIRESMCLRAKNKFMT